MVLNYGNFSENLKNASFYMISIINYRYSTLQIKYIKNVYCFYDGINLKFYGSPIINIANYKVIGIHYGYDVKLQCNIGIIIKYLVIEFLKFYLKNKDK